MIHNEPLYAVLSGGTPDLLNFTQKPVLISLVFKQGFFALQTRLVCTQKKASLQAKEGLFENEAECALREDEKCLV